MYCLLLSCRTKKSKSKHLTYTKSIRLNSKKSFDLSLLSTHASCSSGTVTLFFTTIKICGFVLMPMRVIVVLYKNNLRVQD